MSMYGDDKNGGEKNGMYDEIKWFLENHSISELLEIVADVIRYERE